MPCAVNWHPVRTDITTTYTIANGELALSASNFQSTEAIAMQLVHELDQDRFEIDFRDFYATHAMGRAGLFVTDKTGATVAGCAIRPNLISAFVKRNPSDLIDYRTSTSNVGRMMVESFSDSLRIRVIQGDIACLATGKYQPPFTVRLIVGAEQAPLLGKVGVRFSNASRLSGWRDEFDCNSVH